MLPLCGTCLDSVCGCPDVNREMANAELAGGQTCPAAELLQWLCQQPQWITCCGDFSQVARERALATCHSQAKVRIRKGVF